MAVILAQADIADRSISVVALENPEHRLDPPADAGDQTIASLLPVTQYRVMLVGAVHQAGLYSPAPQHRTARMCVIGLVGIDRSLITLDKGIGYHGLVHVGRGQQRRADQPGFFIDGNVRLVPKVEPVLP